MNSPDIEATRALARKQYTDDRDSIPYQPKIAQLVGGPEAALIVKQVAYWWQRVGRKPFYKFLAPCSHKAYRAGDSWQEEMAFSPDVMRRGLAKVGYKIVAGLGKNKAMCTPLCDIFVKKHAANEKRKEQNHKRGRQHMNDMWYGLPLVVYWTDGDRQTWYMLNEYALDELLTTAYLGDEAGAKLRSAILGMDTLNGDSQDTSKMPDRDIPSFTEITSETTKTPAQEAAPDAPRYAVGQLVRFLYSQANKFLTGEVIDTGFSAETPPLPMALVRWETSEVTWEYNTSLAPAPRYRDTSDDPLDKVGRCCDKCHSILSICDEGLYCNECGWIPPADPPTPPTPKRGRASKTKPAKPAYWGDLVAAVIKEFGEPGGKASKIAEQLAGVAYQGERKDCNCNPPATPEEIAPFIKWYRGEYPGLDLPTSAEALESQWHKFNTFKTKQQHAAAFTPTLDYEPAEPDPHDYLRIPVYEPLGAPA